MNQKRKHLIVTGEKRNEEDYPSFKDVDSSWEEMKQEVLDKKKKAKKSAEKDEKAASTTINEKKDNEQHL
ncbi:unnamed protein product, partial [Mesorhabditis belari]|uniref:Uncharacterized protein n=1 Tax=Mesorhabditis belari TaxID=2138241 RepID=A0AAF3J2B1_9BILA